MSNPQSNPLLQVQTMCGSLLNELEIIWNEVGESSNEKDKMLLELEQECLEVYRRKVDLENRRRALLRQAIADSNAEIAAICSAMGERPVHITKCDQDGSLKKEHKAIIQRLEEMQKRQCDRRKQFLEVLDEIQKISHELYNSTEYVSSIPVVEDTDLSLRKLEEFHRQLLELQTEKSVRLKQILDQLHTMNSYCSVLGMDFKKTVNEVHPSLGDSEGAKNLCNDTIDRLMIAEKKLLEVKIQRMQRLQDLATTLLELWNLMDTPIEEQKMFQNVTCNVAASEHEITEPNMLSVDFIHCVEAEVSRLEALKSSKMKELVLKKKSELEEICAKAHMVLDPKSGLEFATEAIETGTAEPTYVLEQMELLLSKVKEEAFSRKETLEKVEKWIAACEEESWLEEYNRDENRYNAGRGSHLTLKRAEKARAIVAKLPAMTEALTSKVTAWEKERGLEFTYDGLSLPSMLQEYTVARQEKEQERQRLRDQKKLQGQLIAEQEVLFGSKPSPLKPQSVKKMPKVLTGSTSNKRLSVGVTGLQTPKTDSKAAPHTLSTKKNDRLHQQNQQRHNDDDNSAPLSTATIVDVGGLPASPRQLGSPTTRRPFSPIPLELNMAHTFEDSTNKMQSVASKKSLPNCSTVPFSTPGKISSVIDEDNKTPKAVATTLSKVSVPMQTTMTPAAPPTVPQETEYSFEERRAGFLPLKPQMQPPLRC